MKVLFQVFGGTCAVVLAVFIGNVAFTKYQLHEARVIIGELSNGVDNSLHQVTQTQNDKKTIADLSKENNRLRQDIARLRKQLVAYKAEDSAKNRAFTLYFNESEDCLIFDSDAHMVDCQNVKMRAKKEFNRLWDSGQRSF